MEGSHSGLVRSLGKRVYRKVSQVQILYPPQFFKKAVSEQRKRCRLQGDIISMVLEVHKAYINGIETGKHNPTIAVIQKLAGTLGVSRDELLK